jgi:hypothetical protein
LIQSEKKIGDKKIQKADHGYISAFLLCHSVLKDYFESPDNTLDEFKGCPEFQRLRWATAAIAVHNLPPPERELINFQNNAYAFLLVLLDELHDWDREIFSQPKWPNFELTDFEIKDDSIIINIYLWDDLWPDEMVERVNQSLNDKESMLKNMAGKPQPPISINLIVNYRFSTSKISDDKLIEIPL